MSLAAFRCLKAAHPNRNHKMLLLCLSLGANIISIATKDPRRTIGNQGVGLMLNCILSSLVVGNS